MIITLLFLTVGLVSLQGYRKGQPLTEGKIVYEKISSSDSTGNSSISDTLFPFRFTQYFRGHRYRLEVEFNNGKTEIILGDSTGRIWLVETINAKWAVIQNANKPTPKINWRDGKDTEKIAGYKCKEVYAELAQPKLTLICYRSEEVLAPHWFFTSFKHGLLSFELPADQGNLKVNYWAKEAQDYRVAETQLRVPPKYERISEADFYHWLSE